MVYLRIEDDAQVCVRFVAAKARVAPLGGMKIPRLEFLSGLLLSKLIVSVQAALRPEMTLDDPVCYTDSRCTGYEVITKSGSSLWKTVLPVFVLQLRLAVGDTALERKILLTYFPEV